MTNELSPVEENGLDLEKQERYIAFLKSKYKPALVLNEDGKPLNFQMGTSIAPVSYGFEDVNHFVSCESPTYEDMQALCLGMSKHIETLTKGIKCINKIIVGSEGVDCLGDYEAALKLVINDLEGVPT